MKKLLVVAVALASVNAFATKARVLSLGNSPHLIDTQTVFSNPSDMFFVGGDYVTLESGTAAGTQGANTNAEGMVVRSFGNGKAGFALGHRSTGSEYLRGNSGFANFTATGNSAQQNPMELSYGMKTGDLAWGATLYYSNYADKASTATTTEKESTMGLRLGARQGAWDASATIGLGNTAENATQKFTGSAGVLVKAGYVMDTMYGYVQASTLGGKTELTASGALVKEQTQQDLELGVVNSHKRDASEFFYGAALKNTTTKGSVTAGDTKTTAMSLPVWMGLEVDANSWMVFRGSIKQAVLLNQTKTESPTTTTVELAPGASNTTVALGTGFKFNNKLNVDATLATATTQTVNTTNLLGTVGLNYMF